MMINCYVPPYISRYLLMHCKYHHRSKVNAGAPCFLSVGEFRFNFRVQRHCDDHHQPTNHRRQAMTVLCKFSLFVVVVSGLHKRPARCKDHLLSAGCLRPIRQRHDATHAPDITLFTLNLTLILSNGVT